MAQKPSEIDFDKFLKDPSFQTDREFLEKFFDHMVARRTQEAKERAEREDAAQPKNFFDLMFGR